MQELVERMIANIEGTAGAYEEVLATEREKQRAIVASDIDGLTQVVAREEELMARAGRLEAERAELRRLLAAADTRLGPTPRLVDILGLAAGPARARLAQGRERLVGLASQINEVNRVNFQLLRGAINLVRGILEEVFGADGAPATYDASGRHDAAPHAAACVNQVL